MTVAARFAALGALLFLAAHAWRGAPATPPAARRIVLTAADVAALRDQAGAHGGRAPAPDEVAEAIGAAVDEEILHRAALARGLAADDGVVQRRLAQLGELLLPDADAAARADAVRALGIDRRDPIVRRRLVERLRARIEATASEPDDRAVAAFVAAHPERFALPVRLRLTQVFLDPRRRTPAAIAALRRRLAARPPAPGIAALGDPLPLPSDPPPLSQAELGNLLGADLAAAVAALPPGQWSSPLRSAYGVHLVYVHAREAGGPPPLDAVAAAARHALRAARAAQAVRAALARWRPQYEVVLPPSLQPP